MSHTTSRNLPDLLSICAQSVLNLCSTFSICCDALSFRCTATLLSDNCSASAMVVVHPSHTIVRLPRVEIFTLSFGQSLCGRFMAAGFASSRFPASAISDTCEHLPGDVAILVPGRHPPTVTSAMSVLVGCRRIRTDIEWTCS